jgi:hypothetical protein
MRYIRYRNNNWILYDGGLDSVAYCQTKAEADYWREHGKLPTGGDRKSEYWAEEPIGVSEPSELLDVAAFLEENEY